MHLLKGSRPYGAIDASLPCGLPLLMFRGPRLQKRVPGKTRNDTITIARNPPGPVESLYGKKYRGDVWLAEGTDSVRQWLCPLLDASRQVKGTQIRASSSSPSGSCPQTFLSLNVPEGEGRHSTEAAQQNP